MSSFQRDCEDSLDVCRGSLEACGTDLAVVKDTKIGYNPVLINFGLTIDWSRRPNMCCRVILRSCMSQKGLVLINEKVLHRNQKENFYLSVLVFSIKDSITVVKGTYIAQAIFSPLVKCNDWCGNVMQNNKYGVYPSLTNHIHPKEFLPPHVLHYFECYSINGHSSISPKITRITLGSRIIWPNEKMFARMTASDSISYFGIGVIPQIFDMNYTDNLYVYAYFVDRRYTLGTAQPLARIDFVPYLDLEVKNFQKRSTPKDCVLLNSVKIEHGRPISSFLNNQKFYTPLKEVDSTFIQKPIHVITLIARDPIEEDFVGEKKIFFMDSEAYVGVALPFDVCVSTTPIVVPLGIKVEWSNYSVWKTFIMFSPSPELASKGVSIGNGAISSDCVNELFVVLFMISGEYTIPAYTCIVRLTSELFYTSSGFSSVKSIRSLIRNNDTDFVTSSDRRLNN